jgi:phosphate transport system substrate-binding protein
MAMTKKRLVSIITAVLISATVLSGCTSNNGAEGSTGKVDNSPTPQVNQEKKLSGQVVVDGSSTVFPLSEAMAEEFTKINRDVRVTVAASGTGGGMSKFANNELDVTGASRPMKDSEADLAKQNGVEYIELKVAFDGIAVVIHKDNTWATEMTVEELKKIWEEGSTVKTWKDVNPAWPDETIRLYAPGTASGTFEYFTEAVNGKAKSGRADVTASEDDNVLVQGVAGDKYAMAYFGYSYYEENKSRLTAVTVNGVYPSPETIGDGTYKPLSRPIFIYVNKASLEREEVKAFVRFYLENGTKIAPEADCVPLPAADYTTQLNLIK